MAISTIETRKWAITVAGSSPVRTDRAQNGLNEGQKERQHAEEPQRATAPRSTAIAVSSATRTTIVVSVRLVNSITRWIERCSSRTASPAPACTPERWCSPGGSGQPDHAAGHDDPDLDDE